MWSPEARVLVRPALTFRDLVRDDAPGALTRRLVLLVTALGCFVSALTFPRLTPRLIVDGAISFAPVPLIELGALWIVLSRGRRVSRSFAPTAGVFGVFLVGNAPWLLWLLAVGLTKHLVPQASLASWAVAIDTLQAGAIGASIWIDFHFFREVTGQTTRGAWIDLAVLRAIGWTTFVGYFYGVALYQQLAAMVVGSMWGLVSP